MANNGFKEIMNERISFPLNKKSVATCRDKGFKYISTKWTNYFQWKGYMRNWNKILSTSQKISFH